MIDRPGKAHRIASSIRRGPMFVPSGAWSRIAASRVDRVAGFDPQKKPVPIHRWLDGHELRRRTSGVRPPLWSSSDSFISFAVSAALADQSEILRSRLPPVRRRFTVRANGEAHFTPIIGLASQPEFVVCSSENNENNGGNDENAVIVHCVSCRI